MHAVSLKESTAPILSRFKRSVLESIEGADAVSRWQRLYDKGGLDVLTSAPPNNAASCFAIGDRHDKAGD